MKVLQNSAIYLLSNFITKAISVLLIPILTRYLSPDSYGQVLLFTALMTFFNPALYCGAIDLIAIDYFKGEETYRDTLIKSNITVFYTCILATVLFVFISPLLVNFFHIPYLIVLILPLTCLLSYYLELLLLLLRYKGSHLSYFIATLIKTIAEVGITLLFLVGFHYDWYSRILGLVAGFLVAFFFLFKIVPFRSLFGKPDKQTFVAIIKRGAPFIIAQFLIIAFLSVDKFFIPKYFTKHELGLYGIAFQIASLLTIFSTSIISVLQPMQYKLAVDLNYENKSKLVQISLLFIAILLFMSLLLIFVSPLIYSLFINSKYHDGIDWVKYLVIAGFFSGCGSFFMNVVRQKGSGRELITLNTFPLILLIISLFIFPRYFHVLGVVFSYILVNFIVLFLTMKKARNVLNISKQFWLTEVKRKSIFQQ